MITTRDLERIRAKLHVFTSPCPFSALRCDAACLFGHDVALYVVVTLENFEIRNEKKN